MYVQRFPMHPRLGRHMALDERSLSHTIERQETKPTIAPIDHPLGIDILDQTDLLAQGVRTSRIVPGAEDLDDLGSCTGNASVYSLSTSPTLTERVAQAGGALNESYAIQLYHEATKADQHSKEEWPPTDCGSTGLGICKALKSLGLISSYRWARSAEGLAALLQAGNVLIGIPWYLAFMEPDAHGFIDSGGPGQWEPSGLVGGHELCITQLETWDERDPSRSVIVMPNCWNKSWGDGGYCRMRLSTYTTLRKYVDVKQIRV